jgi:hypothetical protein
MLNPFKFVAILFKEKALISNVISEGKKMDGVKAGWKTSEFWFSVVIPKTLLTVGYLKGVIPPAIYAWAMASIAGIYILGRSGLKMVQIVAEAKMGKIDAAATEITANTVINQ